MDINADLNKTAHVNANDFAWVPSPLPGVERVMLDRVGDEVAVATSIVRYAPGSSFSPHKHALGEEFVVLDGIFSDEHADYGPGSYVRNPPGTGHTPRSDNGCVIFVKLRQFADDDLTQVTTSISSDAQPQTQESLYRYEDEEVCSVNVPAGLRFAFSASYYVRELLIMEGEALWQQEVTHTLPKWSWIRMAPGDPLRITAMTDCVVFSKTRPIYRSPK